MTVTAVINGELVDGEQADIPLTVQLPSSSGKIVCIAMVFYIINCLLCLIVVWYNVKILCRIVVVKVNEGFCYSVCHFLQLLDVPLSMMYGESCGASLNLGPVQYNPVVELV